MADQNFRVKRGLEVGVGGTVLTATPSGTINVGTAITMYGASGIISATKFDGDLNALGQTYYVATTGSDSYSGNNINEPYRTVAKALSVATNGDIINISAGTYDEICPLTVPRGVTLKGAGLRATTIRPTDATKTNNVFLLNDVSTVEDFTIRGSYFNTYADTGYSFSYAPGIAITTRSPYIQRITVLNSGSTVSSNDPYGYNTTDSPPTSYIAGAGAKIDGSLVASNSLEAGMLFNEVTFFTPNNKGILLTNGARAEYLNCFHYFASQAIVGTSGTVGIAGTAETRLKFTSPGVTPSVNDVVKLYEGGSVVAVGTITNYNSPYATISGKGYGTFTSAVGIGSTQDVRFFQSDGTTQTGIASAISLADYKMFGAEMRSVGCAVEYGQQGVVADGPGVQLRLFAINFNHVGTGKDITNDPTIVVQADEVVESNGGQVSYVSIDQSGDFRVGDALYINQETGQVSFASTTYDLENIGNFVVTDGVSNQTLITPTSLTVGDLQLASNNITSTSGDIDIDPSGSGEVNVYGNLNVVGILTASVIEVSALQKGDTSVAIDDTGSDGTIRLNTDGVEGLRVTNTQGVGIGSQIPQAKLDVRGGTQLDNINISGVTTVLSSNLKIRNPANTFEYSIVGSAIAANRNLTLPLITGNDTFAVLGFSQTFSAAQTFSSTLTASATLDLTGSTTGTHVFGTNQSSGTLTFGGTSGTGLITFGRSTSSQTTNIQAGATASASTKTINFGTSGLSGSFTQINIGPTAGVGTVLINSGTRLGIGSAIPTAKLDVIGNAIVSGVITATSFSGNASSATYATTAGIATYATTAGIATYASNSGISTSVIGGIGSLTQLNVSGISTFNSNVNISGVLAATSASFSGNVTIGGTLTYEDVVNVDAVGIATARAGLRVTGGGLDVTGIATFNNGTNVASGSAYKINGTDVLTSTTLGSGVVNSSLTSVGTLGQLNVSGVSTLGITTATNLTTQNINNSGITTTNSLNIGATQVISSSRQLQNIASLDATTTATIESAIANAPNTFTDLNVTGISTLGVTSATNLTAQQLNVSGVSTLGIVQISSGIVTATSGVVTYYGDGSNLTNIQASSIVGVTTFATTAGVSTNLKGGLAGNIPYQSAPDTTVFLTNGASGTILQSNGVGNAPTWVTAAPAGAITGLTVRDEGTLVGTASSVSTLNFVGNIVSVASTAGIATITFLDYVSNAGVATYATTAGIATYATNAGVATYATNAGIATNIKGGAGGSIPYQTASDTTSFIANGVAGYVLQSNGGTSAPTWVPAASSGAITGLTIRDEGTLVGTASSVSTLNFVGSNISAIASGTISTITVSDNLVGTALSISGISTFTNGPIFIGAATSTGTASQALQVNSGAYVSGNLGVGATNPTSNLHLFNASGVDLKLEGNASGNNSITFVEANTQYFRILHDAAAGISPNNLFKIQTATGNSGIINNDAITIKQSGDVGIGTTSPTSRLDVVGNAKVSGVVTASQFSTGSGTIGFTTNTISGPAELIIDPAAVGDNTGAVRIKGDLYVDGTQTYINSTTIELADFNVGIATTVGTNALLDGAGIGIGSTGIRKTITWNNTASALTSSEDWNLVSGKQYEINGTSVLSSTTLGSGVVNSSLTSVGTLGQLNVSGVSTALSFVKSGGTSSQFLKADGSVDSNTYLTSYTETDTLNSVTSRGNSTSNGISVGVLTATSLVRSGGTSSQFLKADGSVDSNTYLTSYTETDTLNSITGRGNSTTNGISVGVLTATSLIKSGGTSSQFLKADGSVDSNTYLTTTGSGINLTGIVTSIVAGTGVTISGSTGQVTINATGGGGSSSQWVTNNAGIHTLSSVGIGTTNPTSKLHVVGDTLIVGVVTATSFIKSGGTSSQFLKADGSVDSNSYLTSYTETDTLNSVSLRGNSTSSGIQVGVLTATSATFSGITSVTGTTLFTPQLSVSGIITALGGFNIGIQSGGVNVTTGVITAINFIGAGNTFSYNSSTKTVDISIAGGGGGGITEVVQDTTPQLGGDLDLNGKYITGSGGINITGVLTATSFIKSGGTSSQFLKADGSVDSNTYLTSYTETDTLNSVTSRGNSTSNGISVGVLTATSLIKSGGTSSQFLKADGSVDSNTYLTSYTETDTLNSVTGRGNSTSNGISVGVLTATELSVSDVSTITVNSSSNALRITQTGSGNALVVEDSTNPDSTPFVVNASGSVGIGTTNPGALLHLQSTSPIIRFTESDGFNNSKHWNMGVNAGELFWQARTDADLPGNQFFRMARNSEQIETFEGLNTGSTWFIINNATQRVGIATANPTSKLHVVGDALIVGVVTATDFNSSSDINLKNNVRLIEDPVSKVMSIRGVNFEWKENSQTSAGVIAQEIEEVMPELVKEVDGKKSVNYNGLIGLLIEVVREQQKQIDDLKRKIS